MYSGEYDVCGVTLSGASTLGKLKSLPDHGGRLDSNIIIANIYDLHEAFVSACKNMIKHAVRMF